MSKVAGCLVTLWSAAWSTSCSSSRVVAPPAVDAAPKAAVAVAVDGSVADLAGNDRPILVILLDAVPYEMFRRARAQGLFQTLGAPQPVISSFPSATTVSLAGTFVPLGMHPPPGYEARFFDWEEHKVRGGGLISYRRIETYWADFFDWHVRNPLRKGFGFLHPLRFAGFEIRRGLEEFLASDQPVFLAYVSATDGAAHLHGPGQLLPLLAKLDEELERARQVKEFTTVVLSDHGIEGGDWTAAEGGPALDGSAPPLRNVRQAMRTALEGSGYHLREQLSEPNDVVWVRFGLLTSAVLFTAAERAAGLARVLAAVDGVELCAARTEEADRWPVFSGSAQADVERRFVAVGGAAGKGALELASTAGATYQLRVVGSAAVLGEDIPLDRWLDAEQWLRETASARLPDAPYRIVRAFDLVENSASVVCSIAEGYMAGSALTDWSGRLSVGRLRYTHGSLTRDASYGGLLTDAPGWSGSQPVPAALRHDQVLRLLLPAGWQRAGSREAGSQTVVGSKR
jgi:hypothetical protein